MVDACKAKLFQLVFVARFGAPYTTSFRASVFQKAFGNTHKVIGIIKKLDL
jgi:hypothetical protein